MKKKVEEQSSDLTQDGLRMEKTQRNNFLTLRKQDRRRRLFHNKYKSERISLYQILNK